MLTSWLWWEEAGVAWLLQSLGAKYLAVLTLAVCLFWETQLCKDCFRATKNFSTEWVCPCPSLLLRGKLCWDPPSPRDGLDGLVPPGTNPVFRGSPPSLPGVWTGDIPRGGRDGKWKVFSAGPPAV